MVGPEVLAALDLTEWLGSGQLSGRRLHCNPSTISRRLDTCQRLFGVRLRRSGGECRLEGSRLLLGRERRVHQLYRLQQGEGLRLEACNWAGRLLADPAPSGWIPGTFDQISLERPLDLLRERVIDAWLTNHGLELAGRGDLRCFELCRLPTWLLADPHHPLAREGGLSAGDLARFPVMSFAAGVFPHLEAGLRERGLWTHATRLRLYSPQDWEGRTADQVTLCPGNLLGMLLLPHGPVPLAWHSGMDSSLALVVLPELAEQPAVASLLDLLRRRLACLCRDHPAITLTV